MSKVFEKAVCKAMYPLLMKHGYEATAPCSFVTRRGSTLGVIWLVQGTSSREGCFMPRLSIGLSAVGDDVAVISIDLNELLPKRKGKWFDETAVEEAARALSEAGLPWIEAHISIPELTKALLERARPKAPTPWHWWQRREPVQTSVNFNVLKYLSFCYEALGDLSQALSWWNAYASKLTLVRPGSPQAQEIEARRAALERKGS